ncbi:MAG TPA: glycoside hydrolase family 3 protein [Thermoanaerobaculia bacterium]|nr:glycoside hydrolase family 3 protein [Thermoanaerobaculia bacterium]
MTLEEKIGQLFVVAARAGEPVEEVERHVRENHVGGVIWFQSTASETARVNAHLQSLARVPLLISADLEAGMGMRFTDAPWWPPAMAIAATGDPTLAEEMGRATAREALAIGVNHILAPVADVNVDPRNPVINTRSFGEDPHEVARYVAAFVRGVQSEGCLATAKHFPGHGDTHIDSHRALPVLGVTRERLDRVELVPFRAAIAADVASVMIGHLAVPTLDATRVPVRAQFENVYGTASDEVTLGGTMPATLSKPVVDLLRRDLGFDRLVITDAMDMGGLAAHFDPGEAAVRAIEAGNDQILFSPDPDAAIAAVRERVSEARIDESVRRVLRVKTWSDGLSARRSRPADSASFQMVSSIAERSITLVRDTQNLLPLTTRRVRTVVVNPHADPLDDALRELEHDDNADLLVLLLALRPKSGAGSITVPADIQQLAHKHAQKTIAVAFGSPYVLRELGDISTFVCAWGVQLVLQRAAMRALRGEIAMTGKLPVRIE